MNRPRPAHLRLPILVTAALLPATAAQAEIPPETEAMIREAARIGNGTTIAAVVEVAKSLNPAQAEEIGKLGASLMTGAPLVVQLPPPAIPPAVEAMIREAARSGDAQTLTQILAIARTTNPDDAAAIDALGVTLLAQAAPPPAISPEIEEMIREAGNGDGTTLASVVKVAKSRHPDEARAIDELGARLMGEIQTKQREAAARAREAERARLAALGAFDGWSGQGEAGMGITTGNSEQISALIGLKLNKQGLKAKHSFALVGDYQQTEGLVSRERYSANYGLNYALGEGLYAAMLLGWERDKFTGFARRFTEFVGVGYRAIGRPNMTLDIDGGPALRQTLYTNGFREDQFGARGSLLYRWTLKPGWIFSEDASIVSSDGDTTLISNTALTAKFSEVISGRISFNLQSETDPLPGRKNTDTATRASIVYSF